MNKCIVSDLLILYSFRKSNPIEGQEEVLIPGDPERRIKAERLKNGIPIIFYFNGVHEDYHRPTDTIEKIEFELMTKRAQLVFHTAWVLANREQRIIVD